MSKKDVGEKAGIAASIITRAESGETRLRPANLRAILGAFGIKPGSAEYTEAFALHAADAALEDGVSPVAKPALAKGITSRRKSRDDQEARMLDAFRALSPERRDALLFALYFPGALDGLAAIAAAAKTANRNAR